jgi:release factor glutamine methyltransferase
MSEDVWTPLRLINWTKDFFARKGIEQPRLEAEILLASVLGWERIQLYARFGDAVPADRLAAFREVVKRRGSREPAQYILGHTEFCGLAFKCDRRALIPRPESEIIIEQTILLAGELPEPVIVDVGTGSGNLAVTAAVQLPQAHVVACDVSGDALSLAHENAEHHQVLDRVAFHCGDFEQVLAGVAGRVDVAMANPPYVTDADFASLAPELREHEPRIALVSGPEGTEVVTRLLDYAPTLLKPGGHLIMELGAGQSPRVKAMLAERPALGLVRFEKDFQGVERVAVTRRKS